MHTGFVIALAWPETKCKQAGAWYDTVIQLFGFGTEGYYEVGHAALILIDDETGKCRYYDFGRYHAPHGHGRVRGEETDHDLIIRTTAKFSSDYQEIKNSEAILSELFKNPSTHGDGTVHGASVRVNYEQSLSYIEKLQAQEIVPYGPFIRPGTNCSRFVASAIKAGKPSLLKRIKLNLPPTLTPSPVWNLLATGERIIKVGNSND